MSSPGGRTWSSSTRRSGRSLFAGVLDGGDKDVFLGGSRLNKFMEAVESATAAIPEAMLDDAEEAPRSPMDEDGRATSGRRRRRRAAEAIEAEEEQAATPAAPAAITADPWSALVQAGMALLQQFAGAARSATPTSAGTSRPAPTTGPVVARDERTGETYLKVPMPSPEVIEGALQVVGALLENLRG